MALGRSGAAAGAEAIHELVDSLGRRLPLVGDRFVAGRSAQCDIRLDDELASRRHFMLEKTATGWQITDLNSTNGTSLNGRRLPPGAPAPVTPFDRIDVGHTTFVMQPPPVPNGSAVDRQPSALGDQRSANRRIAAPLSPIAGRQSAIPLWQWIVSAVIVAAAAMLAYGACQPWVRVQVRLTFGGVTGGEVLTEGLSLLDGLLQGVFDKPPLVTANIVEISGIDSYGWFTLLAGCLAVLTAGLDLALRLKRSALPGIVYMLAALLPAVVLAGDVQRFVRLGTVPILFGVDLLEIFEGATKIMEPKVTPLTGLYLTVVGLGLLLGAGILRAILPALSRRSRLGLPAQ